MTIEQIIDRLKEDMAALDAVSQDSRYKEGKVDGMNHALRLLEKLEPQPEQG